MEAVYKKLGFVSFAVCIAGFVVINNVPAVLSISTALVCFLAAVYVFKSKALHKIPNVLWGFSFLYIVYVIWGLIVGFDKETFNALVLKIPILFIPFIFYYIDKINLSNRYLKITLLVATLVGIASAIIPLLLKDSVQLERLHNYKPLFIYTGINHIYFSLFLVFGIFIVYDFFAKKRSLLLILIGLLFLFYLHLFAARTALVAFYASALIIFLLRYKSKYKVLKILAMNLVLLIFGMLSVKYVPSIKGKYELTKKDLSKFINKEDFDHYSISQRLAGYDVSYQLIKSSPWVGYGLNSKKIETLAAPIYQSKYSFLSVENRKHAHNQFIQIALNLGVPIATSFFLFFIYFCYFLFRQKRFLTFSLFIVLGLGMLAEELLDRQAGILLVLISFLFASHQD